jgi:hypothetical protein
LREISGLRLLPEIKPTTHNSGQSNHSNHTKSPSSPITRNPGQPKKLEPPSIGKVDSSSTSNVNETPKDPVVTAKDNSDGQQVNAGIQQVGGSNCDRDDKKNQDKKVIPVSSQKKKRGRPRKNCENDEIQKEVTDLLQTIITKIAKGGQQAGNKGGKIEMIGEEKEGSVNQNSNADSEEKLGSVNGNSISADLGQKEDKIRRSSRIRNGHCRHSLSEIIKQQAIFDEEDNDKDKKDKDKHLKPPIQKITKFIYKKKKID